MHPTATTRSRGGFTLVEMLVSVALVLLIMSIFASAFQIATGNLLKQRGQAENNQRARAVITMLDGDLGKRIYQQRDDCITQPIYASRLAIQNDPNGLDLPDNQEVFEMKLANVSNALGRGIVPLHPDYYLPGVGGQGRGVDASNERGYFYISENDPANDADDVLQFTIDTTVTDLGSEDTTPLTGRARRLGVDGVDLNGDMQPDSVPTWHAGSPINLDQPVWDDGVGYKLDDQDIDGDGNTNEAVTLAGVDIDTSESRYAEVSYFVRNGNLMRRVLLIRDPPPQQPLPGPVGDEAQPTRTVAIDGVTGNPFFPTGEFIPGNYTANVDPTPVPDIDGDGNLDTDFWNDFDFSASRHDDLTLSMRFNIAADLDNSSVARARFALGNPRNRFGHDSFPVTLQGRPKEHRSPVDPTTFMGRYTHEETSHPTFAYPGLAGFNRMSPAFIPAVDQFRNGPRIAEDILMPNVHAFDIKVWDAAIGEWVDLGHRNFNGDWHLGQVLNLAFLNGTFAEADLFVGNQPVPNASALRAMYRYGSLGAAGGVNVTGLDGQPGVSGLDDNNNGSTDDAIELGWPGSDDLVNRVFDTGHPQFNFDVQNNFLDPPMNAMATPPEEFALDDPPPFRPLWTDRPSFVTDSGGNRPVIWTQGSYVIGDRAFPVPRARNNDPSSGEYYPGHQSLFYLVVDGQDLDSSGSLDSGATEPAWPIEAGGEVQDGEIRWRAFNNTIGLQAIQITVRFLDPSSRQMRQVTIAHSFVEL